MGPYRCGSHFIIELCREQCLTIQLACNFIGEVKKEDNKNHVTDLLAAVAEDPRYHLVILNDLEPKISVMMDDALSDWHVIRVYDQDKRRWFRSYFFHTHAVRRGMNTIEAPVKSQARYQGRLVIFYGTTELGHYYHNETEQYLLSWDRSRGDYIDDQCVGTRFSDIEHKVWQHHGTSRKVYEQFLESENLDDLGENELWSINQHIVNHWITQRIPADIEFAYQDLPALATEYVSWQPNDYPQEDVVMRLTHGDMINYMLDIWPHIPGRLRNL